MRQSPPDAAADTSSGSGELMLAVSSSPYHARRQSAPLDASIVEVGHLTLSSLHGLLKELTRFWKRAAVICAVAMHQKRPASRLSLSTCPGGDGATRSQRQGICDQLSSHISQGLDVDTACAVMLPSYIAQTQCLIILNNDSILSCMPD